MNVGMRLAQLRDSAPGGYSGGTPAYRQQDAKLRTTALQKKLNPFKNKSTIGAGSSLGAKLATQGAKGTLPLASSSPSTSPSLSSSPYTPEAFKGFTPGSGTNNWINQLKKQPYGGAPKLPAQIDLSKYKMPEQVDIDAYKTNIATIEDIAKKYGFDYSREYAERQAEAIAQAQRDEIASARERAEWETYRAQENLEHDFFGQYLQQRQQLTDSGLNAGIAAERDLRLDMNRQHALADVFANAQLYNQELDRRSQTIEQEALAYAERLFNERLAQGFDQAMQYTDREFRENQAMLEAALRQRGMQAEEARWMAEMAMRQRQQEVEERWREYEFNNMSASERAKLIADAERFGDEMAWEMHKFNAGLEHEASMWNARAGFNEGQKGGGAFSQYRITSQFGTRKDPITGKPTMHNGVDFAMPMNTPVGATVGGTVIASGYHNARGHYVAIRDSNGLVHVYQHLNGAGLPKGSRVSAGQIIGRSGSSGKSTGPHLHYEVRQGSMSGRAINPSSFI